jgi:glycosyltransferase involved in cell wall biosynthesis
MARILILSFYFEPDLCAGSFRATALVKELTTRLGVSDEVTVVTTMPNRYQSFHTETPAQESRGNVHIDRVRLPSHQSGMADQSRAFLTYARAVLKKTKDMHYDVVFATSSRLMTAALGALAAKRSDACLYLDIRDIFPDTLSDVFAGKPQATILPLLRILEKRVIRKASRINLVSGGFLEYFRRIRNDIEFRTFTNGIDDAFLDARFDGLKSPSDRKVILYAGNIGEGQGLEKVIPEAALALENDFDFWVVGDGGTRPRLEEELKKKGVQNVRLIDPVKRDRLIELYNEADVLFLHLNDYKAFEKVLPSKIFEYAATGKPLLAGVGGYSRRFIVENISNAALFAPCDAAGLVGALGTLEFATRPRTTFVEQFGRAEIIRCMANDIFELCATAELSVMSPVLS